MQQQLGPHLQASPEQPTHVHAQQFPLSSVHLHCGPQLQFSGGEGKIKTCSQAKNLEPLTTCGARAAVGRAPALGLVFTFARFREAITALAHTLAAAVTVSSLALVCTLALWATVTSFCNNNKEF